jgi:hypothetical protein
MKKQTMYNRLQKQYTKLNRNIQKSIQTGRFYAYTQFKQQQLLSRLKRCSFQLKQLGAGVAVVGALGMATPAVAQYPYILTEQTGAANPLDGKLFGLSKPEFVDIDTDGDMDIFVNGYVSGTGFVIRFLENTGDSIVPIFTEQTGSNNPLDGAINKGGVGFVDIDGDGDMDCFVGNVAYSSSANSFFYENTGTTTSPIFTLQSNINNPLDSVRSHLDSLDNSNNYFAPLFSFVDIDADGDQDCFVGVSSYSSYQSTEDLWYYENIGTSATPNFVRKNDIDNPFNTVLSYAPSSLFTLNQTITFADTDNDGDQDAVFSVGGNITGNWIFYENQGTATNATFDTISITPLDMATGSGFEAAAFVDINNDSKLDVFRVSSNSMANQAQYFLNETPTSISNIETEVPSLIIFPNPTTNLLFFDKQVTGVAKVTNLVGQEIMNKVLFDTNQINLASIPKGVYTLSIQLEDNTIISKMIFIED